MSFFTGSRSASRKILFLHSAGGCGLVWHKVIREFTKLDYVSPESQATIVQVLRLCTDEQYAEAPDLLGHGFAAKAETYSVRALAEDLVSRLSLPVDQYDILVGASFGAIVLLEMLSLASFSRITRVVLCDPVLDMDMDQYPPERIATMAQARETMLSEESILRANPSWEQNDAMIKRLAGVNVDPKAIIHLFEDAKKGMCSHSLLQGTKPIKEVIIVAAGKSKGAVYGRRQKDLLVEHYPWVTLVEAEDAAHDMHREDHEIVAKIIFQGSLIFPHDEVASLLVSVIPIYNDCNYRHYQSRLPVMVPIIANVPVKS